MSSNGVCCHMGAIAPSDVIGPWCLILVFGNGGGGKGDAVRMGLSDSKKEGGWG